MPTLTAPQSFATDIGTVMARAQQAAATQSATILSAASNIARSRERAGQAASDAVFRMRLEEFNNRQFAQKTKVANARLAIAEDVNDRAAELQPLNVKSAELGNELKQTTIDDAPLRRSLMQSQLTGRNIANQVSNLQLGALPEQLTTQQERAGFQNQVLESAANDAQLDILQTDQETDIFKKQTLAIAELDALSKADVTGAYSIQYGESFLERLKNDMGREISMDPGLTKSYNDAARRYGLDESKFIKPQGTGAPEGLDLHSQTISTDANGKVTKHSRFENAKPDVATINSQLATIEAERDFRTETFKRLKDSADADIKAYNKEYLAADSDDARTAIGIKREKRRKQRNALDKDIKDVEKRASAASERILGSAPNNQFTGGFPNAPPAGPSRALVGDAASVVALIK